MAKPIAIQLYTVRELCAKDFAGTLKKIAGIGYKGVEFAGLHGMAAADVADLTGDLGMEAAGAHVGLPGGDVSALVDELRTLGATRAVSGVGPNDLQTAEACAQVAKRFQAAAQRLAPHGIELCYHNHWWEFDEVEGSTAYERLLQGAPALKAELDVYWTADGGYDPVEVLGWMGDRAPLLHIKDGPLEKGAPHTAVGAGKLDFPAIVAAIDPRITDWLIVELDHCATDMLEAVRQSYAYLTSKGLAEGNV